MKMPRLLSLALALAPLTSLAWDIKSQSPKDMFLEFKGSPWMPSLDKGFTAPGPYQTTFGTAPMIMGEVELDYQVFQKFGTAAVGISVGYAEKFAKALVSGTTTGERSGESTGLRVVPLKAMAVYRFDLLWLRWDVPLVPYVKGGLVFMPWWVTKGPNIEVVDGLSAIGTKFGLVGTLGVSLTLDFLDRRLARDFDSSMGVNHSYLFAEFSSQNMTLFEFNKSTLPLDFSSNHWMFGLGFEF
jgi:hypothetical protein